MFYFPLKFNNVFKTNVKIYTLIFKIINLNFFKKIVLKKFGNALKMFYHLFVKFFYRFLKKLIFLYLFFINFKHNL